MRTFVFRRTKDDYGVSGTGDVAEGVEFASGKVAVAFDPAVTAVKVPSVATYDSLEDAMKVHCHNDAPGSTTEVVFTEVRIPSLSQDNVDPAAVVETANTVGPVLAGDTTPV